MLSSTFIWIAGVLTLVYYILKKNYSYWESRNVPFDQPVFLFGSLKNVVTGNQHPLKVTRDIYQKFKNLGHPYVGIFTFHKPCLLIISPDLIKKVLVKDFDKFINRSIASNEPADPVAANALFLAHDMLWKNMRIKITPVFTSGKIKLMLPLIKECGENFCDYFRKHEGKSFDTRDVARKYSVDIISSCFFGIDAHCLSDHDSEMMKHARLLLNPSSLWRNFSLFCYFFVPKFVHLFGLTFVEPSSAEYLNNIFMNALGARKDQNIIRHDLIDLLNNLKESETEVDSSLKFDDFKMAAQAISFFDAGNNTTSSIISFALYELALNTKIQEKLRREIRATLDDTDISYENIKGMKYLDMLLLETLRKYPIGEVFLSRTSSTSYTFEETGLHIDKGLTVQIPVAGLHFDPEYFPEPEKFIPERFNDENRGKIPPYTYLPFGDGPRNCIGQRFAILVSKVGLVYALKDFEFKVCNRTSIPLQIDSRVIFLQNTGGLFLRVAKAT